jgi:dihydroorotase
MRIKIRKPDDFHCHLRQGDVLESVIGFTAKHFGGAVAMGNTIPTITTIDDALRYKNKISSAVPAGSDFEPIMTIMLTRFTTPQIVREAANRGIKLLKYIPKGVSTNSGEGVDLRELPDFYPVLEVAQETSMIFSGHWECLKTRSGGELIETEREAYAISFLDKVITAFPELMIVVEHASSKKMIDYLRGAPQNVAATLTVHHALLTFMDVCWEHGIVRNPHNYCKPIAKWAEDRDAVLNAMLSGDPRFFFGSDSAPHPVASKQKMPPAAGCFTAPVALPLLAQVFEEHDKLHKLEDFVSSFGADFYGIPRNAETIELVKEDWIVPEIYDGIVPFMAGKTLHWRIA